MTDNSVLASRRGGPDVLHSVKNDLRPPQAREVRIRTLAGAVTLPDVEARYGRSPFPPKIPSSSSDADPVSNE